MQEVYEGGTGLSLVPGQVVAGPEVFPARGVCGGFVVEKMLAETFAGVGGQGIGG